MRERIQYSVLVVLFSMILVVPAFAKDTAFTIWLTTPSTRILLLVLWVICVCGIPVLILSHKKGLKPKTELSPEQLLDDGNIDQALQLFGSRIKSNPQLLQKLGAAYRTANRTDTDAVQVYEKLIKDNQASTDIVLQLARSYALESKDDAEAIKIYEKAINAGSSEPAILQIAGDSWFKKSEWTKASSVLTQLVTRGNASPETYVQLAQCFLKMQRHDDTALEVYEAALSAAPRDTTLVLALASFYSDRERLDPVACQIYEEALKTKPDLVTVRIALSKGYLHQRKLAQCIEHCQYLIKRGLMDTDVKRLLAGVHLESGQVAEAEELYSQLHNQFPNEPEYIIGLARSYAGLPKLDDTAFDIYQKALELNDELVNIWEQVFKIYVNRMDIGSIVASAERLLTLSPESLKFIIPELEKMALRFPAEVRIPLLLGDAYCISKQMEYAISSYDRASELIADESGILRLIKGFSTILESQPNSREARMRRAKLYLQADKLMDAIRDFEWIHEKEKDVPEVSKTLMTLYQSLVQTDESVPPLIRFNLGKLYEEQKLWQDAILEYQNSAKHSEFEEQSALGMARCFLQMKQFDIAMEGLTKLPLTEESKDVLYDLAQAYRQHEKYDKAMEILDKIYAADSKYKDVGAMLRESRLREMESKMEKTTVQKTPVPSAKSRFRIIEEIARGGMGVVCCAMDTVLNEMVALKMLPKDLADDPQVLERFLREVRATRKLVHRNIVRVYDIVEEEGNQYISMEYVVGKNLRELLREKGRLKEIDVAHIMKQVCSALQVAHEQGVVHRDIKPANIMIDSTNTVKVMDFGIAKMKNEQKLTLTTDFLGTPLYMSPEQTQGLQIDPRSDIYSLGILMYELLSGEVPFNKGNIGYQHIHVIPPPPEYTSKSMQKVVMKCIEKKPSDRFQDAYELREVLEKLYPQSERRKL